VATELTMPRLSDSMEEGTILKWLVAEGDEIEPGRPLVEVETDKATVTHEAQETGVVLALLVGEGDSARVGAPIAMVGARGEEIARNGRASAGAAAGSAPAVASGAVASATPGPPAFARSAARAKASPLARRLAARAGLELAALTGSGPQGRVIRADVERALAGQGGAAGLARASADPAAAATRATPATPAAELDIGGARGEVTVHELSRIQQTVARRMAQSRATVPDIELRAEVDMGELVELRERLRDAADPPPSINDFIVKACALALREFPRVNGAYRDGRFELFSRVNVGVAVAGEDALLVPVIFDADTKPLGEISRRTRELAARVRDGSIAPSQLSGATFTISNLGMYGVDGFSAVIDQPQSAILAVGAVRPRAVVDAGGAIVARPTAELALACDHRILYGADGARFLARVRALLERPLAVLVA